MTKILFGEYLKRKGLISEEQLNETLKMQQELNKEFGELAVAKKLLSENDVKKILEIQKKKKDKKFGELAVSTEKLTSKDVDNILKLQSKGNLHIGEIFCLMGILPYEKIAEELEKYKKEISD